MTEAEDFIDLIKRKTQSPVPYALVGKVESVEGNTCTVLLLESGVRVTEVLLTANIKSQKGLLITPAKESDVHLLPIGNDEDRLQVVGMTEIDSVAISMEDVTMTIDKDGYQIVRDDKDLKTILTDLINIVTAIVVVQGKGPDVAKLKTLTGDIAKLLK